MSNRRASERGHTPRTLRALAGLSQEALAERSGVSAATVATVESGGSPNLGTLERMAGALGVTTSELVQAVENERERARRAS